MLDCAQYIGVPFKSKGRDPSGWDCWGLCRWVIGTVTGHWCPSFADEYRSATRDVVAITRLFRRERLHWHQVDTPRPLDVILLTMARSFPTHVALVVDDSHMLHVERGCNTVIENFTDPQWEYSVVGFFRRDHG